MLPFFPAKRKPGRLSILPQGGRVTLAYVIRAKNTRPEVRFLDSFAIEKDERDALQRLRISHHLKSYLCSTLMGDGEYNISQLDAPLVPENERKEALRWLLKDMVNFPVESACIDVLDIPSEGLPPGRSAGVLVVSASEQAVRMRVAAFEAAKIPLEVVDIPELAQRNVAALLEDENRGLVFLRVDEAGMMLTLTFRGELIAVRRGEMNTLQLNGSDEDQRERVKERLVLEAQRSLDNFDRQYSHIPVSRVVVASYPHVENLIAELRKNIYVPVVNMDLSSAITFSNVPELKDTECQAQNVLAIGAALRTSGALG